ncbi:hypothetical protein FOL47_002093 [Perkinsus chesapeaki]|uniref:Geranylgeranyl transferase type II subunit beta n=1 Tax=Perkinsus chesapeaki TaxID=330153 RepID=A0A7J6MFI9_PERCH|nr:hypothetical protein FOL47_002093 [Perkinsus chesapeaki]
MPPGSNPVLSYVDAYISHGVSLVKGGEPSAQISQDFMDSYRGLAVETSLLTGLYWLISTKQLVSLYVPCPTDPLRPMVDKLLKSCYRSGGFAGSPTIQSPSVIPTTSALQLATMFGIDLSAWREEMVSWLLGLISIDGLVSSGSEWLEVAGDIRFVYCVTLSLTLLGHQVSDEKSRSLVSWIVKCQGPDGGFGQRPGCESHAGHTFCAVASMKLLHQKGFDSERCILWLKRRIVYPGSEGCTGRPGKRADSCYVFWVMAALSLLGQLPARGDWLAPDGLRHFIGICFDKGKGGIAPSPECPADPFHTYFALTGLSIAALGGGTVELGGHEIELRRYCVEKALVEPADC